LGSGLREKTRHPDKKAKQTHHGRFEAGRQARKNPNSNANARGNVTKTGDVSQSQPVG
jgi:hypothetical protein